MNKQTEGKDASDIAMENIAAYDALERLGFTQAVLDRIELALKSYGSDQEKIKQLEQDVDDISILLDRTRDSHASDQKKIKALVEAAYSALNLETAAKHGPVAGLDVDYHMNKIREAIQQAGE